jgi:hypothetical protein
MADIRINALATTAASTASDDFVAVDGSANGTRKLNAYSPTFGGNLTVSGTGTSSFGGKIQSSVATATGYNQLYDTTGITTGRGAFAITSTGASLALGIEASVGGTSFTGSTAYASYFGTRTATPIHFINNDSIRATLTSTGNLLIGGVIDGGQKLQVNGTASFADAVTVGGADKVLTITSTASTPGFTMRQTGGIAANRNWGIVINNSANGDFILRRSTTTSGDPTTAVLTFDSSSNATFAGDLTVSGGNVGVGGAPSAGIGVRVSGTNFAGLYQYGLLHDGELSGTTESNGLTAAGSIKASTAVTDFNAISVVKPGMGSGASIVTSRGLQITNLGVGGGITHVYGIDIQAQSGAATTNVAIRAAGKIMFTSLPTSSVGLATGELWNDSGTVKIAL